MRRSVRATTLAPAAAALAACSDAVPITAPTAPAAASSVVVQPAEEVRDGERHYVALAARYPQFAGYHIDSAGVLVVGTTGAPSDSALLTELAAYARTLPISAHERLTERRAALRRVRHPYRTLAQLRDRLERDLSDGEVTFFDVDEIANKVVVGVEPSPGGAKRSKVAVNAARLALPAATTDFVETARAIPAVGVRTAVERRAVKTSATSMSGTVNNSYRPLAGGLQIDWPLANGNLTYCTLGFGLDYDGVRYLVTNSYCSQQMFSTDLTPFAQGSELDPNLFSTYYAAREYFDAPQRVCYSGQPCRDRESDALLANPVNVSEAPLGYITRTLSWNGAGGWAGGYGSRDINQATPTMRITGSETGLSVGTVLDKVGATTGWTYGRVTRGCVDTRGTDGYLRKCTHYTDQFSLGGDSGSPEFLYQGNTVILYGILWGGDRASYTVYSGYRAIEHDHNVRDQGRFRVAAY